MYDLVDFISVFVFTTMIQDLLRFLHRILELFIENARTYQLSVVQNSENEIPPKKTLAYGGVQHFLNYGILQS